MSSSPAAVVVFFGGARLPIAGRPLLEISGEDDGLELLSGP
jgi:hypothetical protein